MRKSKQPHLDHFDLLYFDSCDVLKYVNLYYEQVQSVFRLFILLRNVPFLCGRKAHQHFRGVSLFLWVSVPLKADMGHWTACRCRAAAQTRWTCLRQGPEREFSVMRKSQGSPIQEIQI